MSTYNCLIKYLQNEITQVELRERCDDLIYEVKESKTKNRKLSTITLRFGTVEDYFNTFRLDDSDSHFVNMLFSNYYDYMNIYDSYYADEDWIEGRMVQFYFDDDNISLLKEIVKYVSPESYKKSVDNWERQVFQKLYDMFGDNIKNIISEFSNKMNEAYEEENKIHIKKDFENLYFDYGIYTKNGFYTYFTTPQNLIDLYEKFDPTKEKTLTELLTTIGEEIKPYEDFWSNAHDVSLNNFDEEGFNREVTWQLEKMKDLIIDNSDSEYSDFQKFNDIFDKISSKYDFDKWYELPVNRDKMFKINQIDPKTNKVKISVKSVSNSFDRSYLVPIEGFYSLLFNYELFK